MIDLAKMLIVDMSPTFAFVAAVLVVCVAVVISTFRATRGEEIRRRAREEVRSQELNQINHSLSYIKNERDQRIRFLEGKLQGQGQGQGASTSVSAVDI